MADARDFHEDLDREHEVKSSSDRSFGLVFAGFFGLIGVWPALRGLDPRLWALSLAASFLVAAFVSPDALRPLNRLWTRFGLLLSRVTNPIIMALMFFGVIVPTALIMRLLRRDALKLKIDRQVSSYWVHRQPPGPPPENMRQQF